MIEWGDEKACPEIEDEHQKLYRMMARMEPVILDGRREASISRALRNLYGRIEAHFALEEDLAEDSAPESCALLRDEHRAILNILARLRTVPAEDSETRRTMFADFIQALARHDNEVDGPLFRMVMN